MMRLALATWSLALSVLFTAFIADPIGAQAPVVTAPTEQDVVYMCPMHPDVRGAAGDTCSRCGMTLVRASAVDYEPYLVDLDLTPRALHAGQKGRVRFLVRNPRNGSVIQRFETVHERVFHLFIVSQDLEFFRHVHPVLHTGGALDVDVVLPRAGVYQMVADFVPTGAAPQLVQRALVTAGYSGSLSVVPQLLADLNDKVDQGTRTQLQMSPLVAGREQLMTFDLADALTGAPIVDLEPYLGATGHLFAASADLSAVFHSHPVAGITSAIGPTIVFQVLFPRAGMYRLWAQFQRHGRVSTVTFTVPVAPRE